MHVGWVFGPRVYDLCLGSIGLGPWAYRSPKSMSNNGPADHVHGPGAIFLPTLDPKRGRLEDSDLGFEVQVLGFRVHAWTWMLKILPFNFLV